MTSLSRNQYIRTSGEIPPLEDNEPTLQKPTSTHVPARQTSNSNRVTTPIKSRSSNASSVDLSEDDDQMQRDSAGSEYPLNGVPTAVERMDSQRKLKILLSVPVSNYALFRKLSGSSKKIDVNEKHASNNFFGHGEPRAGDKQESIRSPSPQILPVIVEDNSPSPVTSLANLSPAVVPKRRPSRHMQGIKSEINLGTKDHNKADSSGRCFIPQSMAIDHRATATHDGIPIFKENTRVSSIGEIDREEDIPKARPFLHHRGTESMNNSIVEEKAAGIGMLGRLESGEGFPESAPVGKNVVNPFALAFLSSLSSNNKLKGSVGGISALTNFAANRAKRKGRLLFD